MTIPSNKKPKTITSAVTIVAILLAIIFLYLTLRDLNWQQFWNTLVNGKYQYLALTIPIASFNYFLRSLRWGILLRSENKIPRLSIFWANMIGYLGNSFLPARAGEVLRSVAISRNFGISTSFTLATALTERIMDVVALVIISSISLLSLNLLAEPYSSAVKTITLLGLIGLVFVILLPRLEKQLLILLNTLTLSENWIQKISDQLSLFLQGMGVLQKKERMVPFLMLTALIWLIDGIDVIIGINVVSAVLTLPQALVLLSALGLSSAIPSTPGYIGVYQFAAVSVLVPFGISKSAALAFILLSQVANYIIVGVWGVIGFLTINIKN